MSIKNIPHVCDCCGKHHLIDSSTNNKLKNGKQKNCYCSKECKSLSQHTGYEIECEYCHKKFYRTMYRIDKITKKGQNNFCSSECQTKHKVERTHENRQCEICGKIFECTKKSTKRFCSHSCQNKWQTTLTGESSNRFNSEIVECTLCGKEFYARKSKIESGRDLFCSNECRRTWFTDVTSKSEKHRLLLSERMVEGLKTGRYNNLTTEPQIIVNNILDKNKISYLREYGLKYYALDNYLVDSGLMIEVMGDYWHCNPIKYCEAIYDMQKNSIRKDKAKHSYIKNNYDVEVLYLWEHDIINNTDMCEKLILEYIDKNGKLENYHSFNYVLKENRLYISDSIIDFHY